MSAPSRAVTDGTEELSERPPASDNGTSIDLRQRVDELEAVRSTTPRTTRTWTSVSLCAYVA